MRFKLKYFENGKPEVCEGVLRSLPDWFGIEKVLNLYQHIKRAPMIVAYHNDEAAGFSIKIHSEHMVNLRDGGASRIHRQGVGKLLLEEASASEGEGVLFKLNQTQVEK